MIRPDPRQLPHGWVMEKKPWLWATMPEPPHTWQVSTPVPGSAPEP